MGRNTSIDLVKVIAMIMIVAMHTNIDSIIETDSYSGYTICISTTCGIAIPLFFMVSGYLISLKEVSLRYILKKEWGIIRFVCIVTTIYLIYEFCYIGIYSIEDYYLWFIQHGPFWQFWYLGSMMIMYLLSPFLNKMIISEKIYWYCFSIMGISFIAFILNLYVGFEQDIIQTFLLWEWCMYYLIGGTIRKNQDLFFLIPQTYLFLLLAVLIIMYRFLYSLCGIGNQYLFGSGICALYAIVLFVLILKTEVSEKVTGGGKLFLPVYTIHIGIIHYLGRYIHVLGGYPSTIRYGVYFIVFLIVSVAISLILLKIPLIDKIFKL